MPGGSRLAAAGESLPSVLIDSVEACYHYFSGGLNPHSEGVKDEISASGFRIEDSRIKI